MPSARRLSLRARLTLTATAAVAVALVVASGLLLVVVRHSVLGSLDQSARQQAKDVAALVSSGRLPDPLPIGAGTAGVQVIDAQGRVLAVSAGTDRLTPLLEPAGVRAVRGRDVLVIPGARLGTPDPLRVVGFPARGVDGASLTVLVAVSAAEANGSVRALAVTALLGSPVLIAGFALVCWMLVGRALLPVARLRSGAEEIAAAGSADGRRLPVPPAQDEVRRLAVTLNGMLDRLEGSSAAQRAFVADAAHELRSPLAAIRTQLEVARAHPGSGADWDEAAAGVLADTARLARLVDDLLLLARTSEAQVADARRPGRGVVEPIDLAELAVEVAGRPGWRVPVTATGPPVTVAGDRDGLTRVLTNLVDNAARHAASRVVVATRAMPGRIELVVTDDGPGVPEADRDRVFERFTRLDEARSRTSSGGSGLGLAIVRSLVTTSGGRVHLEPGDDPHGGGTRAVVSWPSGG